MERISPRIALLATGDEIVNGDILNTNGPAIAQQLIDHGMSPGSHMTVDDEQARIAAAILTLLEDHSALIIIGGLGPTSDDRTRFALADAIQQPLIYDDGCWQLIVERLTALQLAVPDSNKQQCYFPPDALIIPNKNGTAAACQLQFDGKDIFMLPGPPSECLPIFEQAVLPFLQANDYALPQHRRSLYLLGASEADVGEQCDRLVAALDCQVGYRAFSPYLEVKLFSAQLPELEQASLLIQQTYATNLVSDQQQTASEQCRLWLAQLNKRVVIDDRATKGLLETTLTTPATVGQLQFSTAELTGTDDLTHIRITGFDTYWKQETMNHVTLTIQCNMNDDIVTEEIKLFHRGKKTLPTAVEYICWSLKGSFNF